VADRVFVMNWGWHWTTSAPGAPDDMELCRRVADYVAAMPNRARYVLGTQMYGMDWPGGGGPPPRVRAAWHSRASAGSASASGAWAARTSACGATPRSPPARTGRKAGRPAAQEIRAP
jgi:spore germination protein YaaH